MCVCVWGAILGSTAQRFQPLNHDEPQETCGRRCLFRFGVLEQKCAVICSRNAVAQKLYASGALWGRGTFSDSVFWNKNVPYFVQGMRWRRSHVPQVMPEAKQRSYMKMVCNSDFYRVTGTTTIKCAVWLRCFPSHNGNTKRKSPERYARGFSVRRRLPALPLAVRSEAEY